MSIDREYKIRIQTVTEGAGAQQAAQGLKDTGKAAEEAGEGMKFLETRGREWHKLIVEIDRVAPGLGQALRVLFNPATLGITGIVFAFEKIKSAFDDWKKKMDDMAEAGAKADFAESIKAALDVTREAIDAADEWQRKRAEIAKGEHGITAELNNQLQLIAAIQAAQQQQAEAEKTLALAKIKGDEALGNITPTQAIEKRAAAELEFARKKAAADAENIARQQQAREAAQKEAADNQEALDQKAQAAADKFTQGKDAKAHAQAAPSPEEIQKALDAVDEAQRKLDERKQDFDQNDPGFAAAIKSREDELDAAKAQLQREQEQKHQADAASKIDVEKLKKDADAAQKAADDNRAAAAKARDESEKARNENVATAGARGAAERAGEETITANERTELMQRARELQKNALTGSNPLSKQDAAELLQLMRELGEKFFEQGANAVTKTQFQNEVQNLKRLIESKK